MSEEFEEFEHWFYRDLEKYFSADLACCDDCYESYLAKWPVVNHCKDSEFQKISMEIEYFYKNSRLTERYSYEQFKKLIRKIACPNCGSNLTNTIWPYNLPINISPEQERAIEEIGLIAMETPFMVLKHQYAKKVFNQILKIGKKQKANNLVSPFYRARMVTQEVFIEKDFFNPPKGIASEGRYNHIGFSVLYLGDHPDTSYSEMRKPSQGVYMADIHIKTPLKILDLHEKLQIDNNILQPLLWSSLMSSNSEGEGLFKPHYSFTRFVADCAKYAGFDGIFYPSVRNGDAKNLVLLKPESIKDSITVSNIRLFNG